MIAIYALFTLPFILGLFYYFSRPRNIIKGLNLLNQVMAKQQLSPALHVCGQVYSISYIHNGRTYEIFFPIEEETKKNLSKTEVYVNVDDVSVSIDQEPGVPYLVKPGHFSNTAIVTLYDTLNETTTELRGDQGISKYL